MLAILVFNRGDRVTMTEMSWLLIGYGSLLRRDDGVGQRIAAEVADWELPGVRSLPRHQLMPELAESLADVDLALFVDASLEGNEVRIEPLSADSEPTVMGHHLTPSSLLGMTQWLYERCPQAWLISIPGQEFGLGEGLSESVEEAMTQVLQQLREWFTAANPLVLDVHSGSLLLPSDLNPPHSVE